MDASSWRIECRPGGWARASTGSFGIDVFLRIEFIGDGGLAAPRITEAAIRNAGSVSARTWRSVPFDAVLAYAQNPASREVLQQPPVAPRNGAVPLSGVGLAGVGALARYFDQTRPLGGAPGYGPVRADKVMESDIAFRPVTAPAAGSPLTGEFLQDVADLYRWAVAHGKPPAPLIASTAEVPVSRVHRWVAVARERGVMSAAIRGKAG